MIEQVPDHSWQPDGHVVQAPPVATAIDTGSLVVTSRESGVHGPQTVARVPVFEAAGPSELKRRQTIFSVSNRQKATIIHYGQEICGWFEFKLAFALAVHSGHVDEFLESLRAQLRQIEQQQPLVPASLAPGESSGAGLLAETLGR